ALARKGEREREEMIGWTRWMLSLISFQGRTLLSPSLPPSFPPIRGEALSPSAPSIPARRGSLNRTFPLFFLRRTEGEEEELYIPLSIPRRMCCVALSH